MCYIFLGATIENLWVLTTHIGTAMYGHKIAFSHGFFVDTESYDGIGTGG
jgi:hypothetical protein